MECIDESILIARAQAGESTALGVLYDRYITDIYRFVSFKTRSRVLAEDITSDIFLTVVSKLHLYDAAKGSFRTWMYTIARRTIIDHYRKERDTVSISDGWDIVDDSSEDLSSVIDAQFSSVVLEHALQQLTAEQRDIIIMRLWEDMAYDEIANILDSSPASCRMAYSRAVKALGKELPSVFAFLLLLTL
jgi:RNA polymerase sigma-70 factor (ECF subfamily)